MKKCAIALFSALFLVSGARGSETFTDGISPQQRQQIQQLEKVKQEALKQAMLKKQQEERQKQILLKQQQEAQRQAALKKAQEEKQKQEALKKQQEEAQKQAVLKKQQEEAQKQAVLKKQQEEAQKQVAIQKALAEKLKQEALKKQHEQQVAQKQQGQQGQQAQQVSQFAQKVLKKVRRSVMKQLVATKLVIRKSGQVGQFAQKLRDSLKGVDERIVAFANDQGIELQTLKVSGQSRTFAAIGNLSGTALERAWVKAVHDAHVRLIARLEAAREGADGAQKALIDLLLPVLKANMQEAAKLLANLGG